MNLMRYSKFFLRTAVISVLWLSAGHSPAAEPAGFNVQLHIRNLASSDRTIRREASLRLSQAGHEAREAVPALIKALDDQDDQVWFNTVTALARIGPDAREAIPALLKQLTTSNQNRYARQAWLRTSFALGSIGPEALPALREALKSGQPHVRSGAAKAITWIGPDAVEAVPALIGNLGDERADVREQTAEALGSIGQPALAPVLATLRVENPRARQGAALALEWLKDFSSESVPSLVAGLEQEKDDATRASFVKSLTRLKYTPNEFLSHLLPALGTESALLRQEIHNALLDMEPAGSTSVPALERILRDPASPLREPAAYLLGRIGPAASPAVPHLIAARKTGEDAKLSTVCEAALVEIGAPAVPALIVEMSSSGSGVDPTSAISWAEECVFKIGEEAVPALTRALASPEDFVRAKSLRMLARLGKASAPAAGDLARFAEQAGTGERALALEALAAIPAPGDQLFPLAEQALRADDLVLRRAGVRAMASLGKSARPALPALIRSLEDSDAPLAAGAAEAIAHLGVAGESAVPVLLRRLEAPPLVVQVESARALGVLGEAAKPALPLLLRLLAEAPVELRSVAADALGNMGEAAREALPEIRKNLQSPDAATRAASLQACLKIEGDAPRNLTPLLIQSLEDPAQAVRWLALESIGRFGSRAQSAEPAVFERLDDTGDRGLALATLQQIRPNNVDLLVARLPHEDAQVRLFAVERLGQLGARASNAVEALEARRQDTYEPVSRAARASVRAIQRAMNQPRNNQ